MLNLSVCGQPFFNQKRSKSDFNNKNFGIHIGDLYQRNGRKIKILVAMAPILGVTLSLVIIVL